MPAYLHQFIGPMGNGALLYIGLFPLILIAAAFFIQHKAYSHKKKVGIYVYLFILAIALGLVLFPFPDFGKNFCENNSRFNYWQLAPFTVFQDIQSYAIKKQLSGFSSIFYNRAFLQGIFNIFLILPLGFIGTLLFNWNFKHALLTGFLTTLSFELVQGTGLLGIFPCAYRLFDIDDLWLNSLGFIIGWLMASPLKLAFQSWLNTNKIIRIEPAFLSRRLIATLIDALSIIFTLSVLIWPNLSKITSTTDINNLNILFFDLTILIFWLVVTPYFTRGFTLGLFLVGLRITHENDNKPSILQLIIRYHQILLYPILLTTLEIINTHLNPSFELAFNIGFFILSSLISLSWLIIYPLSIELSQKGQGIYEKWSKTKLALKAASKI